MKVFVLPAVFSFPYCCLLLFVCLFVRLLLSTVIYSFHSLVCCYCLFCLFSCFAFVFIAFFCSLLLPPVVSLFRYRYLLLWVALLLLFTVTVCFTSGALLLPYVGLLLLTDGASFTSVVSCCLFLFRRLLLPSVKILVPAVTVRFTSVAYCCRSSVSPRGNDLRLILVAYCCLRVVTVAVCCPYDPFRLTGSSLVASAGSVRRP